MVGYIGVGGDDRGLQTWVHICGLMVVLLGELSIRFGRCCQLVGGKREYHLYG